MALASDIAQVRRNVNEPTEESYTDAGIGALVDLSGVAGASYSIWMEKAGRLADLVNTSEAGASRALSDLHKNALDMAKAYKGQMTEVVEAAEVGRPVIRTIVR